MAASVHFKLSHNGETRRFALSRSNEGLFDEVMERVTSTVGTKQLNLFWKDVDSPSISPPCFPLDTPDDLKRAIDHIVTYNGANKPPCLHLVVELAVAAAIAEQQQQAVDAPAAERGEEAGEQFGYSCTQCIAAELNDLQQEYGGEQEEEAVTAETEEDYLDALERHLQAAADAISKEIRPLAEAAEVKLQAAVKSVKKGVASAAAGLEAAARSGIKEVTEFFDKLNENADVASEASEEEEEGRRDSSEEKKKCDECTQLKERIIELEMELMKERLASQFIKPTDCENQEVEHSDEEVWKPTPFEPSHYRYMEDGTIESMNRMLELD